MLDYDNGLVLMSAFISLFAFLCGGVFVLDRQGIRFTESRLLLGLVSFSSCMLSQFFLNDQFLMSVFLMLLGGLTVLTVSFSFVVKSSYSDVNLDMLFSFWLSGVIGLLLGISEYLLVFLLSSMILFVNLSWAFSKQFQLNSSRRTLIVECDSFKVLERIQLLLKVFKVELLKHEISRKDGLVLSVEYKAPAVVQHIIQKHIFSRPDVGEVVSQ